MRANSTTDTEISPEATSERGYLGSYDYGLLHAASNPWSGGGGTDRFGSTGVGGRHCPNSILWTRNHRLGHANTCFADVSRLQHQSRYPDRTERLGDSKHNWN